jgi:hypothetical protein
LNKCITSRNCLPFRSTWDTPQFYFVLDARSCVFCVMFYISWFVLLSYSSSIYRLFCYPFVFFKLFLTFLSIRPYPLVLVKWFCRFSW